MTPYPWRKDTPIGKYLVASGFSRKECRWLFRLKAEATGFAYFSLAMNFTDTGEATLSIWPVGVSRPVCWSI